MKIQKSINTYIIKYIFVFTIAVVACSWLVFTIANFSGFSFVKLTILLAGAGCVFIVFLHAAMKATDHSSGLICLIYLHSY